MPILKPWGSEISPTNSSGKPAGKANMPSGLTINVSAGASGLVNLAQAQPAAREVPIAPTQGKEAQVARVANEQFIGRRADEQAAIQQDPPRVEAKYGLLKKKKRAGAAPNEEEKEPGPPVPERRISRKA